MSVMHHLHMLYSIESMVGNFRTLSRYSPWKPRKTKTN